MNRFHLLQILSVVWLSLPSGAQADAVSLPRSSPEAQGVSSAAVRAFVEAADQRLVAMHSFMLVRHGHVVAECWWKPEAPDRGHVLYSLSKSFTSTAVGFAVAEGKLSVDDPVLKFFREDAPENPSDKLKAMRVRDLLTMSTGHETEPKFSGDVPWAKSFLAHPVPHKPGAHFLYNSPGSYMLAAIVQKVTGETVLDYLKSRLFEPLGIENPEWGTSPQGINLGGWGLKVRTEDIAKFGQLYLQKGKWNGKQLIPAAWVEQATTKQVSNGSDPTKDWDQGYGFQFWRCRHGAYRGDGAFGQFCVVLPEQDAVIAITANTRDMQAQLNVVWDKLLPAFQSSALPANAEESAKLKETFAKLAVPANHVELTLRPPGAVNASDKKPGATSTVSLESPLPAGAQAKDHGLIGAGEGPAWKDGSLYFTDGKHINRMDPNGKTSVFRDVEQAGSANGLMFDREGRLIACESGKRRVTRTEADGSIVVLADNYQGKPFNTPNDLALDSKGRIYFTDPRYGSRDGMEIRDVDGKLVEGIYRIDAPGVVRRIEAPGIDRPNGILVSPNDQFLYVADNNNNTHGGGRRLVRFDLDRDGLVVPNSRKVIFDWKNGRGPDGMKMDRAGRLYVAAGVNRANEFETDEFKAGCYILAPSGQLIAFVPTGPDEACNCAFGGKDGKTLFITSGNHLWSVPVNTPGWSAGLGFE
jgi:CubicO group peptidase (beta-lactamase class C family)/sugar lactone lactonase YvrE